MQRLLKHAHMKLRLVSALLLFSLGSAEAQSPSPGRSTLSRVLHPFGGGTRKAPHYSDPRIRGLLLELTLPTEPTRLSEVRQLPVRITLTNTGAAPLVLDFPTSQRIDIHLLNAAGEVLTRWSDNRVFAEETGTVLINPRENVVYEESIATRELQPGKVYTVEVFLPKYSELRVRQKFLTAQ